LAILLSSMLGGGGAWPSALPGDPHSVADRWTCEAEDAADAEARLLPPLVVLPLEQLFFATHCHDVVPLAAVQTHELLLTADHSARGPPAA
jgi:hypothetical protein